MGEMDPDLVSASCFQGAREEACHRLTVGPSKALQDLPMGDSWPAAPAHRLFVTGVGVAPKWGVDCALRTVRRTPDQSQIAALERTYRPFRRIAWTSARWAVSVLATTIRPVVSLSSRWTMPGRLTPPMPDRLAPQCAISALTRVPEA